MGGGRGKGAGLGLEVLVTQGSEGRVPDGQLGQIQGKGSAAELLQQMGVTDVQDLVSRCWAGLAGPQPPPTQEIWPSPGNWGEALWPPLAPGGLHLPPGGRERGEEAPG